VSKWDQILKLFHTGIKRFGNIDSVISNAGLNSEDLFNDSVDSVTGDLLAPDLKSLEINMVAQYYIVRCANYYFSQDTGKAHQIIMTASAASYIDTPPLAMYSGAKAGILGIMRSLRTVLIKRNITINVVAPWMTGKAHQCSIMALIDKFP
jgi:NAD(P)-dependent dehydrogenase (short-subunit alcohol dehydrogenase family)